ncbi:Glutamine-rich protein 2 [Saguinus oedipus]|uniref:Glutamine-rich protein 2 n=1 Tax=Saguinus oedipus TaxID=9490 RepID=A0ABQ9VTC4_SAGOE|nr:Glutamine-rich protein 2 [Saguinus oedipus]
MAFSQMQEPLSLSGQKADKSALATKVSRTQFDATTEQLNHMMQELVAKMSGQEQDWQKILDKLLTEMDTKLDRLELDPLKQLLEDRWKSLRQQLRERPPLYQADEAAVMRRQLLAHFHCLSCDRPLETTVTGQAISVTPAGPGLPGHCSIRPYTVFELEQIRQHSRKYGTAGYRPGLWTGKAGAEMAPKGLAERDRRHLKLGTAFHRGDLAQMEQSVRRLRSMHSKMLMNIEKVQIHFGGSTKASSQVIRELLQAQCLSSPCYKRVTDMANYTYSTVPRPCGGSHTLTYPYHRRLQHLPRGLYPTEEIQIAMKACVEAGLAGCGSGACYDGDDICLLLQHDEVDILGLDGHIYKGRMDIRLPGIPSKDSEWSPEATRCLASLKKPPGECSQVEDSYPASAISWDGVADAALLSWKPQVRTHPIPATGLTLRDLKAQVQAAPAECAQAAIPQRQWPAILSASERPDVSWQHLRVTLLSPWRGEGLGAKGEYDKGTGLPPNLWHQAHGLTLLTCAVMELMRLGSAWRLLGTGHAWVPESPQTLIWRNLCLASSLEGPLSPSPSHELSWA